jgi:hypothetical protein
MERMMMSRKGQRVKASRGEGHRRLQKLQRGISRAPKCWSE